MTDRLICTACNQPIPNGQAVVRSRLFEQRHFHAACLRPAIPEQRSGEGADVSAASETMAS
jgi:hypothetical protein